jgi:hydrogenase expression/formation protein HypE
VSALGISVVTGHTARYAGCNYPMVGGATMFGVGKKAQLIIPCAKVGDVIIVSKGPAIETTGLMVAYFPQFLEEKFGKDFVKRAQKIYYQMSTVKDALIAAKIGGVTAMHDATECGVFGGLYEMAIHSKVGMHIYLDEMVLQEEVKNTCECFGIDPYVSISEGTLLATAHKNKAGDIVSGLKKADIPASIVGEVVPEKEGVHIFHKNKKSKLVHPHVDPFWAAFEAYLAKK